VSSSQTGQSKGESKTKLKAQKVFFHKEKNRKTKSWQVDIPER
jgi:hypothetical protein